MTEANNDDYSLAIIGMAGRFPGAPDVDKFWQNLCSGAESLHVFSDEELVKAGESPQVFRRPEYVRVAPVLNDIDQFDAGFFGLSPRDASLMDPQHRLFLEVAWHAMENAGYASGTDDVPVGVFAACGMNSYMMHHLMTNSHIVRTVGEWLVRHAGNDMNFLATRVSYQMNLKGPSANVQTACSSSLVALHLACQSLLAGECELALVGASTIVLPQDRGYLYKEGEIMSSTGHCRPFDARSDGTLFGSGAGAVVVKRLGQARDDGDTILAIVRGSAINNDGSEKVGYLAPSVEGQARVVAEAVGVAGIAPERIGFIETHGTGTAVGDPIEIAALAQVFDAGHARADKCVISSVKANIGHLGEAAGMASLMKAILCLQHRKLPPTINYDSPNPELNLAATPFEVRTHLTDWRSSNGPLVAGVTSLGAGGTNAHVILEEAAKVRLDEPSNLGRPELLLISAKTKTAAEDAARALGAELESGLQAPADYTLYDVAHTLQRGRRQFAYRTFAVCGSQAEVGEAFVAAEKGVQLSPTGESQVVFMFPGGGAQYEGMGRELYQAVPEYRRAFDDCMNLLPSELSSRIRQLVLNPPSEPRPQLSELERPTLALPALFATEYALAVQLEAWGVRPHAYIGHSMGEYVAACRSGVLGLSDALTLVLARGRLFETLPEGAMLSVEMSEAELVPLLSAELSVAAVNADTLCVASGPVAAISALETTLRARQVEVTRLHISVAAHSKMLDPILDEFAKICRKVRFGDLGTPFVSTLTGTWITDAEARDPNYWVRHLRNTVRFSAGVRSVLGDANPVLVEVGPGRTLASLARMSGAKWAITTVRHPNEAASDVRFLLSTVGRAWQGGAPVDFAKLFARDRPARRVPLPGYQFQRQSYWIEPGQRSESAPEAGFSRIEDLGNWFQVPAWHRAPTPAKRSQDEIWLLIGGSERLAKRIAGARRGKTIIANVGPAFVKHEALSYTLCPWQKESWDQLFEALQQQGIVPHQIVQLMGFTTSLMDWIHAPGWLMGERYQALEQRYFGSMLALGQACSRLDGSITVSVVANSVFAVDSGPVPDPHKALLLGPTLVIPRELPHVRCRCIDFAAQSDTANLDPLLRELEAEPEQNLVALRGASRWVRRLVPAPIAATPSELALLPEGCVVVISGGLGGIGLTLAKHLATLKRAKLVLLARAELPEKKDWADLVRRRSTDPALAGRLKQILEIEQCGGQVLTFSADVAIEEHLIAVRARVHAEFGKVQAVIHAAGAIHDAPMDLKTLDEAHSVITGKALGALILERVFGADRPRLFVGCSSVSSILGLPGQSDYSAANAFLDAFVESAMARGKFERAISIGWNAWKDVGMAVSIAERSTTMDATLGGRIGPHPCLERMVSETQAHRLFATQFSRVKHWLVGEHVVTDGEALIPGTGYLEMARAGLELEPEASPVRISNVVFVSPFFVGAGAGRELFLELTRESATRFSFAFYSKSVSEPHATGSVEYVNDAPPSTALAALRQRFQLVEVPDRFLDQSFMDFGPRWGNIRGVAYGQGEALIHLELARDFTPDLSVYRMHPALLDMATGGAQRLIPGFDPERDFYVPFAYESLTLYSDLPVECFSHVRFKSSLASGVAMFDVSVVAADGSSVLEVRGFTMKRVDREFSEMMDTPPPNSRTFSNSVRPAQLTELIETGIAPAEGAVAFTRILESGLSGTVYTSSVDIGAWLRRLDMVHLTEADGGEAAFERPNLETSFVAPRNSIEVRLAGYWTELLGTKSVGVNDDFFELGGHSLVAVRLFNKIRRGFEVDLPLSALFEAPTIAALARVIAEEASIEAGSLEAAGAEAENLEEANLDPTPTTRSPQTHANGNGAATPPTAPAAPPQAKRWTSLISMQPRGNLTPFYCVAGMGGNLHNLRKLALFLGQSRPVYGLQPPGANDSRDLLYTVEALAEHYINALRTVQPHGPYCLGGYSGGGVVAFEMARQLAAAGEKIAFLGFLDSYSPVLPKRTLAGRARIHLDRLRQSGGLYALGTLRRRFQYERGRLALKLSLRHAERAPAEGEDRYQALAASWVVASARYQPKPFVGSATLFRAKEAGVLAYWTAFEIDENYGWAALLTEGVQVEICPGNHSDMCEEPNVRTLAAKLREALDRATLDIEPRSVRQRHLPREVLAISK